MPVPFRLPRDGHASPSFLGEDPFTTPKRGRATTLMERLQQRAAKSPRQTSSPTSSGLQTSAPALTYPFIVHDNVEIDKKKVKMFAVVAGNQYILFSERQCAHDFAEFHQAAQDQTHPGITLEQTARFANFSRGYVVKMDTPLVLPDAASTTFMQLTSDVLQQTIFADAEVLGAHLQVVLEELNSTVWNPRSFLPIEVQRLNHQSSEYGNGKPVAIRASVLGDAGPLGPIPGSATGGNDPVTQEIAATTAINYLWDRFATNLTEGNA